MDKTKKYIIKEILTRKGSPCELSRHRINRTGTFNVLNSGYGFEFMYEKYGRVLHSSPVEAIEIIDNGIMVVTKNSMYVFVEVPIDHYPKGIGVWGENP